MEQRPSRLNQVLDQICFELGKAMGKHPQYPTDPLHALAILGEEFGELTKDTLQLVYEPHKTSLDNVKAEALQTATMAVRFLLSIDEFEFKQSQQHNQAHAL